MTDPNNPPAFPIAVPSEFQWADSGMTLRDWFAGQALAGICANPNFFGSIFQQSPEAAADFAAEAADAMLEGLEPVDISVSFRGSGSGGEVAETSARYETHLYDLSALKEAVG